MNKKVFLLLAGMLCWLISGMVFAKDKTPSGSLSKGNQSQGAVTTRMNLANWSYWMKNSGQSGRDPFTSDAGGFYPRGTTHVIFADGFVWAGLVNNTRDPLPEQTLRMGGGTFFIGTTPGHIIQNGTPTTAPVASDANTSRIYRIRKDFESLAVGQATVINDAAEINSVSAAEVTVQMQLDVIDQYISDWNDWPADLGAPMEDDGEGNMRPGIAGADQVIWFAANDLNPGATEGLHGSRPIGLELQVTAWCYNQPGATLGQLFFKRYRLINKSGFAVDSMFLGQWCDPDVGDFNDDLVGSDVERSLGFAYSGNLTDLEFDKFNLPPAAVGYDFFQGPLVQGKAGEDRNNNGVDDAEDFGIFDLQRVGPGLINLPMSSFGYFASGSAIDDPEDGDYQGTLQWYNLLNGFITSPDTANPTPFFVGFGENRGQPTKFPVSGDPVRQTGDIDAFGDNLPPGDRRMVLNTGPFSLPPWTDPNGNGLPDFGEEGVQEVTVAIVGGIVAQVGGNNRNAVAQLKLNDDFSQFIFDNLFQGIPSPPPQPGVKVTDLEDKIVLEWGTDIDAYTETEKRDPELGFHFEGYNVYQLPNINATRQQALKIATFDLDNPITQINAAQFVPEFGDIIIVPVQNGTNSGIQRFFTVDRDRIKGGPIFAGNEYYFAVTAYNAKDLNDDGIVDDDVPEPSLESAFEVIVAMPQSTIPGTRYPNSPQDAIEVTKVGTSTGSTAVSVVDPDALKGKDYRVEFNQEEQYTTEPILDSLGNVIGFDTLGIWHTWNLVDGSGTVLLSDQRNLSGDNDYQIVDGLLVQVSGPTAAGLAGWDFEGNRWITGVDWGAQEFFNGLDIGAKFFGSSLGPADLVPVKLEFQDQADVEANGYVSEGWTYRRDLGYPFSGIGQAPWAAYDVSDPANPRRLNICFVEDDTEGAPGTNANLIWDMGWNGTEYGSNGAREYMFILKSDYAPDPNHPVYTTNSIFDDAEQFDVLYAIWPDQRGERVYLLAPFTMDIFANLPNTPGDSYTFSTESVIVNNRGLAEADVERVNVYPNPYYAFNPGESSRFDRFVTFSHLPESVTIRIFTISGVQVRKLTEEDKTETASQFLKWDLRNESDLPVASGLYVAHIDMPELSKRKVLKLFIIQSAEILEFF